MTVKINFELDLVRIRRKKKKKKLSLDSMTNFYCHVIHLNDNCTLNQLQSCLKIGVEERVRGM
jgi:hypothetical protein